MCGWCRDKCLNIPEKFEKIGRNIFPSVSGETSSAL